ncbi:hypothetical protein LINPERPRIM_LOCUS15384 [Linum perenne]
MISTNTLTADSAGYSIMDTDEMNMKVVAEEAGSTINRNLLQGEVVDELEDYRPIDPVPSSKASVKPGPIEHGTPLNPFIPRSPPPVSPPPSSS